VRGDPLPPVWPETVCRKALWLKLREVNHYVHTCVDFLKNALEGFVLRQRWVVHQAGNTDRLQLLQPFNVLRRCHVSNTLQIQRRRVTSPSPKGGAAEGPVPSTWRLRRRICPGELCNPHCELPFCWLPMSKAIVASQPQKTFPRFRTQFPQSVISELPVSPTMVPNYTLITC
jgi:hypothetical protein